VGAPVKGPLFDFAPAINEYLKTHLFGDIFERDNLDWQSRELATVGMLSALPGADSQLQSHMGISMNVGLTANQLRQLAQVLAERVDADAAKRAREALARHLATRPAGKYQPTSRCGRALPSRHDSVDAALSLARVPHAIGNAIMPLSMVSPRRTPASKRSATMSRIRR
jgi:alkylhydroperoxidase/carboxymuconolactone decarboxylase family protein YurZ